MSFLSNIGSSISHIAQEAVHDIENMSGGGLAQTITSLAKTGLDSFMKDLGGGLEKMGQSFLHAGQDIVQQFSQPGGLTPPANPHVKHHHHHHTTTPTKGGSTPTAGGATDPSQGGVSLPQGPGGYAPLPSAPTAQGDTGVVGTNNASLPTYQDVNVTNAGPKSTADVKPDSKLGTGDPELDAILKNPGASIESKIFALLMKLSNKKEQELDKSINGLGDATSDKIPQAKLADLQRIQSDLSELNQMTTNMMKNYKDMKDSIIGNLR